MQTNDQDNMQKFHFYVWNITENDVFRMYIFLLSMLSAAVRACHFGSSLLWIAHTTFIMYYCNSLVSFTNKWNVFHQKAPSTIKHTAHTNQPTNQVTNWIDRKNNHEPSIVGCIAAFDDFDDQVRVSFDTRNASDTLN